jgi:chromosome condensin MukBEF MukE localization factor
MRRLFWLAMGITIGALVVRKLSAAAERMTPAGILGSVADGLRQLAEAIGDFGADVRAAAAEREAELRTGTGLDAPLPARAQLSLPAALPGRHAADN